MMAIASRLARAVNRIARRSGAVLAERYHVRMLPTPREVYHALRYVLLNARKHSAVKVGAAAVCATDCVLDPASSARWFDGWKRTLPGEALKAPPTLMQDPTVASARSWLLRVGWRRHGLLDPADVPG